MAVPALTVEAVEALRRYDYPGNVRELENVLERALALSGGEAIGADDLNLTPAVREEAASGAGVSPEGRSLPEYLDELERAAIQDALEKTRYNKTAAARLLGITFRALRYRMERLGMN